MDLVFEDLTMMLAWMILRKHSDLKARELSDLLKLVAARLRFFALATEPAWHEVLLLSLKVEVQAFDLKWDLKVTQHVAAKFAHFCVPRVRHEVASEVRDRTAFLEHLS